MPFTGLFTGASTAFMVDAAPLEAAAPFMGRRRARERQRKRREVLCGACGAALAPPGLLCTAPKCVAGRCNDDQLLFERMARHRHPFAAATTAFTSDDVSVASTLDSGTQLGRGWHTRSMTSLPTVTQRGGGATVATAASSFVGSRIAPMLREAATRKQRRRDAKAAAAEAARAAAEAARRERQAAEAAAAALPPLGSDASASEGGAEGPNHALHTTSMFSFVSSDIGLTLRGDVAVHAGAAAAASRGGGARSEESDLSRPYKRFLEEGARRGDGCYEQSDFLSRVRELEASLASTHAYRKWASAGVEDDEEAALAKAERRRAMRAAARRNKAFLTGERSAINAARKRRAKQRAAVRVGRAGALRLAGPWEVRDADAPAPPGVKPGKTPATTLLMECAAEGSLACVQFLLVELDESMRADPWATDTNGATALHYAATAGHADMCALLLDLASRGAPPGGDEDPEETAARLMDTLDLAGQTALHCAAAHNSKLCVETLEQLGCNLGPVDARGFTPAALAERRGLRPIADLLHAAVARRKRDAAMAKSAAAAAAERNRAAAAAAFERETSEKLDYIKGAVASATVPAPRPAVPLPRRAAERRIVRSRRRRRRLVDNPDGKGGFVLETEAAHRLDEEGGGAEGGDDVLPPVFGDVLPPVLFPAAGEVPAGGQDGGAVAVVAAQPWAGADAFKVLDDAAKAAMPAAAAPKPFLRRQLSKAMLRQFASDRAAQKGPTVHDNDGPAGKRAYHMQPAPADETGQVRMLVRQPKLGLGAGLTYDASAADGVGELAGY